MNTQRNITLKNLKPIVRTLKRPEQIVDEYLDGSDKYTIIKYLSEFQKTQGEWDSFRKKIPDELLNKWAKVMKECRANGFISPKIENNNIHWKVVMTLHPETCDKCTLCPSTYIAGDCKGKLKMKREDGIMKRNWTPCWRDSSDDVPF
jgi:hypothetical protein